MSVRMAAVAGQFYEASPQACQEHIRQLLPEGPIDAQIPETIVAGVVPHAGWVFSGDLAGLVFASIKQQQSVDTFVIFGAVHTVMARRGLLYDVGQWGTPLGTIDIDEDLADAILDEGTDFISTDTGGHSREHSIEVQIPFIQYLFNQAKIVPLMVPPMAQAPEIGQAVARALGACDKKVVCIASTDLTHYGPSYGFTQMGVGPEALKWAKETNDKFFIDLTLTMQADKLVDTAQMYGSACGA
ncbi:MAG: AmmeMemoRadiSam system protein B, partial [Sedimentisphaerales bacterium]|nr:AmmeMemoRadiSam system protein B [Sedimentisphaerales bacterium]